MYPYFVLTANKPGFDRSSLSLGFKAVAANFGVWRLGNRDEDFIAVVAVAFDNVGIVKAEQLDVSINIDTNATSKRIIAFMVTIKVSDR